MSAAYFEFTTGFEAKCVIGSSNFATGSGGRVKQYVQNYFYDLASLANRITKIGFKTGSALAAAGTVTIDLQALDSPDGGTGTVSLSSLLVCYIQITSSTGLLTIGNAAANQHLLDFGAAAHTRTIRPNGPGHCVADYSGTGYVVDATHKDVKLLNSHGSEAVDYIAYFGGE